MLGLPVISVAQAEQLASAGTLDGRFAAVGGYWNQFALPCPFMPHQALMTGFCLGSEFADTAEAVTGYSGGNFPNAPISAPETGRADTLWSTSGDSPAAVVVIVHAGDSRAWQCIPDERAACQTRMVIDSVAWMNGSATEPALPVGDLAPRLTFADIAGFAAKSEQVVTAYPLLSTQINEVDPRFLGQSSGIVWYVRLAKVPSETDGISDGIVRLVSDASSMVVGELPLAVASDYRPGRLIVDQSPDGGNGSIDNASPHFTITSGADVLVDASLGAETTPIALEARSYVLHGSLADGDGKPTGSEECVLPVTIAAEANVAYFATYTKTGCSWAPGNSQF